MRVSSVNTCSMSVYVVYVIYLTNGIGACGDVVFLHTCIMLIMSMVEII